MRFVLSLVVVGGLSAGAASAADAAVVATANAQAAATRAPAAPRALASSLRGTSLVITWRKTSGTVEAKVRTTVGGRSRTAARATKASKGRLTVKVAGAKGSTLAPTAVKVRARRCTRAGGAKRCSVFGPWKGPAASKLPGAGPASPSPTAPGGQVAPVDPTGKVPTIGGCPVLPVGHPFNQDVSALPLDPRSDAYIRTIGADGRVHPDFGAADLGQGPGGFGIPYRVVPMSQPFVRTTFSDYADESDTIPGAVGYPVPLDAPIEGGPDSGGDRHVLVVRQGECKLYEMGNAYPRGDAWEASGGAIWDLATGERPPTAQPGWTSADAAGLPILPALVRYDEVAAGEIRHAVRFTVSGTQRAYIAPASHWTGNTTDPDVPPMGLRLRMRADFDLSRFTGQSLVVATALKRYGMIVADNGSDWYVSGAADPRWDDEDLNQLKTIPGTAFEVVKTGEPVRGS